MGRLAAVFFFALIMLQPMSLLVALRRICRDALFWSLLQHQKRTLVSAIAESFGSD